MIPAILAIYAMSAPAAYLAGDVFNDVNDNKTSWLPIACALLPPLGAVIAMVCITNATQNEEK